MDLSFSPVFAAMDPERYDAFATKGVRRQLRRDQPLYLAGDRPERVHVISRGVFKFMGADAEGRDTIFGLAYPGETIGEAALLERDRHALDAVAATKAEVIGVDGEMFMRAVAGSPAVALEVARQTAARYRWIATLMLERATAEVPARLAGRLLDLAQTMGRMNGGTIEMDMPLYQEDLGRLSGMCRESASKTLARFRREGLIDYKGRRLRIHRPDALDRIRCAGRA